MARASGQFQIAYLGTAIQGNRGVVGVVQK